MDDVDGRVEFLGETNEQGYCVNFRGVGSRSEVGGILAPIRACGAQGLGGRIDRASNFSMDQQRQTHSAQFGES